MLKYLPALLVILSQSVAFASPRSPQHIRLAAGSSVTVNMHERTVVTCDASQSGREEAPLCKVKKLPTMFTFDKPTFGIFVGEEQISGVYGSFDDAVKTVPTLRDAGLCR